jgi:hypothetical protein
MLFFAAFQVFQKLLYRIHKSNVRLWNVNFKSLIQLSGNCSGNRNIHGILLLIYGKTGWINVIQWWVLLPPMTMFLRKYFPIGEMRWIGSLKNIRHVKKLATSPAKQRGLPTFIFGGRVSKGHHRPFGH